MAYTGDSVPGSTNCSRACAEVEDRSNDQSSKISGANNVQGTQEVHNIAPQTERSQDRMCRNQTNNRKTNLPDTPSLSSERVLNDETYKETPHTMNTNKVDWCNSDAFKSRMSRLDKLRHTGSGDPGVKKGNGIVGKQRQQNEKHGVPGRFERLHENNTSVPKSTSKNGTDQNNNGGLSLPPIRMKDTLRRYNDHERKTLQLHADVLRLRRPDNDYSSSAYYYNELCRIRSGHNSLTPISVSQFTEDQKEASQSNGGETDQEYNFNYTNKTEKGLDKIKNLGSQLRIRNGVGCNASAGPEQFSRHLGRRGSDTSTGLRGKASTGLRGKAGSNFAKTERADSPNTIVRKSHFRLLSKVAMLSNEQPYLLDMDTYDYGDDFGVGNSQVDLTEATYNNDSDDEEDRRDDDASNDSNNNADTGENHDKDEDEEWGDRYPCGDECGDDNNNNNNNNSNEINFHDLEPSTISMSCTRPVLKNHRDYTAMKIDTTALKQSQTAQEIWERVSRGMKMKSMRGERKSHSMQGCCKSTTRMRAACGRSDTAESFGDIKYHAGTGDGTGDAAGDSDNFDFVDSDGDDDDDDDDDDEEEEEEEKEDGDDDDDDDGGGDDDEEDDDDVGGCCGSGDDKEEAKQEFNGDGDNGGSNDRYGVHTKVTNNRRHSAHCYSNSIFYTVYDTYCDDLNNNHEDSDLTAPMGLADEKTDEDCDLANHSSDVGDVDYYNQNTPSLLEMADCLVDQRAESDESEESKENVCCEASRIYNVLNCGKDIGQNEFADDLDGKLKTRISFSAQEGSHGVYCDSIDECCVVGRVDDDNPGGSDKEFELVHKFTSIDSGTSTTKDGIKCGQMGIVRSTLKTAETDSSPTFSETRAETDPSPTLSEIINVPSYGTFSPISHISSEAEVINLTEHNTHFTPDLEEAGLPIVGVSANNTDCVMSANRNNQPSVIGQVYSDQEGCRQKFPPVHKYAEYQRIRNNLQHFNNRTMEKFAKDSIKTITMHKDPVSSTGTDSQPYTCKKNVTSNIDSKDKEKKESLNCMLVGSSVPVCQRPPPGVKKNTGLKMKSSLVKSVSKQTNHMTKSARKADNAQVGLRHQMPTAVTKKERNVKNQGQKSVKFNNDNNGKKRNVENQEQVLVKLKDDDKNCGEKRNVNTQGQVSVKLKDDNTFMYGFSSSCEDQYFPTLEEQIKRRDRQVEKNMANNKTNDLVKFPQIKSRNIASEKEENTENNKSSHRVTSTINTTVSKSCKMEEMVTEELNDMHTEECKTQNYTGTGQSKKDESSKLERKESDYLETFYMDLDKNDEENKSRKMDSPNNNNGIDSQITPSSDGIKNNLDINVKEMGRKLDPFPLVTTDETVDIKSKSKELRQYYVDHKNGIAHEEFNTALNSDLKSPRQFEEDIKGENVSKTVCETESKIGSIKTCQKQTVRQKSPTDYYKHYACGYSNDDDDLRKSTPSKCDSYDEIMRAAILRARAAADKMSCPNFQLPACAPGKNRAGTNNKRQNNRKSRKRKAKTKPDSCLTPLECPRPFVLLRTATPKPTHGKRTQSNNLNNSCDKSRSTYNENGSNVSEIQFETGDQITRTLSSIENNARDLTSSSSDSNKLNSRCGGSTFLDEQNSATVISSYIDAVNTIHQCNNSSLVPTPRENSLSDQYNNSPVPPAPRENSLSEQCNQSSNVSTPRENNLFEQCNKSSNVSTMRENNLFEQCNKSLDISIPKENNLFGQCNNSSFVPTLRENDLAEQYNSSLVTSPLENNLSGQCKNTSSVPAQSENDLSESEQCISVPTPIENNLSEQCISVPTPIENNLSEQCIYAPTPLENNLSGQCKNTSNVPTPSENDLSESEQCIYVLPTPTENDLFESAQSIYVPTPIENNLSPECNNSSFVPTPRENTISGKCNNSSLIPILRENDLAEKYNSSLVTSPIENNVSGQCKNTSNVPTPSVNDCSEQCNYVPTPTENDLSQSEQCTYMPTPTENNLSRECNNSSIVPTPKDNSMSGQCNKSLMRPTPGQSSLGGQSNGFSPVLTSRSQTVSRYGQWGKRDHERQYNNQQKVYAASRYHHTDQTNIHTLRFQYSDQSNVNTPKIQCTDRSHSHTPRSQCTEQINLHNPGFRCSGQQNSHTHKPRCTDLSNFHRPKSQCTDRSNTHTPRSQCADQPNSKNPWPRCSDRNMDKRIERVEDQAYTQRTNKPRCNGGQLKELSLCDNFKREWQAENNSSRPNDQPVKMKGLQQSRIPRLVYRLSKKSTQAHQTYVELDTKDNEQSSNTMRMRQSVGVDSPNCPSIPVKNISERGQTPNEESNVAQQPNTTCRLTPQKDSGNEVTMRMPQAKRPECIHYAGEITPERMARWKPRKAVYPTTYPSAKEDSTSNKDNLPTHNTDKGSVRKYAKPEPQYEKASRTRKEEISGKENGKMDMKMTARSAQTNVRLNTEKEKKTVNNKLSKNAEKATPHNEVSISVNENDTNELSEQVPEKNHPVTISNSHACKDPTSKHRTPSETLKTVVACRVGENNDESSNMHNNTQTQSVINVDQKPYVCHLQKIPEKSQPSIMNTRNVATNTQFAYIDNEYDSYRSLLSDCEFQSTSCHSVAGEIVENEAAREQDRKTRNTAHGLAQIEIGKSSGLFYQGTSVNIENNHLDKVETLTSLDEETTLPSFVSNTSMSELNDENVVKQCALVKNPSPCGISSKNRAINDVTVDFKNRENHQQLRSRNIRDNNITQRSIHENGVETPSKSLVEKSSLRKNDTYCRENIIPSHIQTSLLSSEVPTLIGHMQNQCARKACAHQIPTLRTRPITTSIAKVFVPQSSIASPQMVTRAKSREPLRNTHVISSETTTTTTTQDVTQTTEQFDVTFVKEENDTTTILQNKGKGRSVHFDDESTKHEKHDTEDIGEPGYNLIKIKQMTEFQSLGTTKDKHLIRPLWLTRNRPFHNVNSKGSITLVPRGNAKDITQAKFTTGQLKTTAVDRTECVEAKPSLIDNSSGGNAECLNDGNVSQGSCDWTDTITDNIWEDTIAETEGGVLKENARDSTIPNCDSLKHVLRNERESVKCADNPTKVVTCQKLPPLSKRQIGCPHRVKRKRYY